MDIIKSSYLFFNISSSANYFFDTILLGVLMLRKITSTLLTVSFVFLAGTGITMFLNKELSKSIELYPIHEFFAILMVLFGIIHIVLNFKAIKKYLSNNRIKILFISLIGFTVIMYIFALSMRLRNEKLMIHEDNQHVEYNK